MKTGGSRVVSGEARLEHGDDTFRAAALGCLDGLFGFAMTLTRDRAAAEDLVQETYLRAFSARHRAVPGENLRGWLFTILRNTWLNVVRRPRLENLDATGPAVVRTAWTGLPEDPEELLARTRLRDTLRSALEELPAPFREVVVLRCVEGFSYLEIARILDCPVGTVMSRLARGRALLRLRLSPAAPPTRPRGRPALLRVDKG